MATKKEELEAKLAAIRSERASLLKEKSEEEVLEARIALEEIGLANTKAIQLAEAQLGEKDVEFAVIDSPLGCLIVKKAQGPRMRQFMDLPRLTTTGCEHLVMACIHYPEKAKADEIFEEFPQLLLVAADALVELSKGSRKETEGK